MHTLIPALRKQGQADLSVKPAWSTVGHPEMEKGVVKLASMQELWGSSCRIQAMLWFGQVSFNVHVLSHWGPVEPHGPQLVLPYLWFTV